ISRAGWRPATARASTSAMWRIGIDVGGTFTDLAAVDETGRVVIAKCASTPRDQSEGLMEGLGLLAGECGTDLAGLLASTERIVHATTVAVCYLHAYRNPRHERLTARALARRLRGVYVSLSSVVLPQIKEYERIWTTVVNAYVGPALARYLNALRARLAARGYRGDVLI